MKKHTDIGITVLVSALNEETVVAQVVRDIHAQVDSYFQNFEIILFNDGSTDRTGDVMDAVASELAHIRVIHNPKNEGLGAAYKKGIAEAKHDYFMLLCGDGGLPAASLPPIFAAVGKADIVAPYMVNLRRIKSPFRYWVSRSYTGLLNLVFRQDIKYYNGLPVHRTALLRQLKVNSTRFAFQGEVMTKLLKAGCTYVQVGVNGAENTNKSTALKLQNVLNVAKILVALVWDVAGFDGRSIRLEPGIRPRSATGSGNVD